MQLSKNAPSWNPRRGLAPPSFRPGKSSGSQVSGRPAPRAPPRFPAPRRGRLVGVTGVEPVTLRLSSACSNQLSYTPIARWRANLKSQISDLKFKAGGAEGIRTPDLQLAKLPLYQLSYSPTRHFRFPICDFGFQIRNPKSSIRNSIGVRSLPLVCSKSNAFEN